jgi:hypothetical protein
MALQFLTKVIILFFIFVMSNETETSSAGEQLVRDKFDE